MTGYDDNPPSGPMPRSDDLVQRLRPVSPEMLRGIVEQFEFTEWDIEWHWLNGAADRIDEMEALNRTQTELRRATQEANNRLTARIKALETALKRIVFGYGARPDERWHCGDECAQAAQDTAREALDDR